jgi:transcription-repair coupling factor (superfamily II helicase)
MGNYPEGMQRFLGIAFETPASLLDYLPTNTLCVIDEVEQCHAHSDRWLESVEQEWQFIESKYNIEIKDEEVENIVTFDDLIELIKIKL